MRNSTVAVVVTVILAFSFMWAVNIISGTAISLKTKGYLGVKGYATKKIKSDIGRFSASIEAEDKSLENSHKKLAKNRDKVTDFLKNFNMTDTKIRFLPVEVEEKFKINERGFKTDEFLSYKLNQDFVIESRDADKIAEMSEKISELLKVGVKINIAEPEYFYSKLEDLKIEIIGKATANAKERAETIAKEGGFGLGPISSVRVGVFQITPVFSTDVSDYGINDTASRNKEIKSVVDINYFIK